MKKIVKSIRETAKKIYTMAITVWVSNILTLPAFAEDIASSKLAKGTEKLIQDLTTWLMILAPVITGLMIIYFCIRRAASDEMDTKKWNNRIIVAVGSCILAVLGSGTLQLLISYYK